MASTLHPFNGPDRGSGFGRFTYQYQEPTPFRHIEVFYNDRLSALAPHSYIPQKLGVSLFSEGGSVLVMKVTGWKPRSGDPVSNPQPIDGDFLIEEQIMPDYENVITD